MRGPHVRQVLKCRTLLLGYHLIQQHSLGPVQGCGVLHQLHAVIQQGPTFTRQGAQSQTEITLTGTTSSPPLTFSELSNGPDLLLL